MKGELDEHSVPTHVSVPGVGDSMGREEKFECFCQFIYVVPVCDRSQ